MPAKFDVSAALRVADNIAATPKKLGQVQTRAIASMARALKPEASRRIRDTYNIRAGAVSDRLETKKTPEAVELIGYYRGTGLLNYGARASKKSGVSVTVLKADGPQKLRHAFKATGLSGNAQIFERRGPKRVMTKGKYIGQRRQPLQTLYGPSVASTLKNTALTNHLADFAMSKLSAEIARQFRII